MEILENVELELKGKKICIKGVGYKDKDGGVFFSNNGKFGYVKDGLVVRMLSKREFLKKALEMGVRVEPKVSSFFSSSSIVLPCGFSLNTDEKIFFEEDKKPVLYKNGLYFFNGEIYTLQEFLDFVFLNNLEERVRFYINGEGPV